MLLGSGPHSKKFWKAITAVTDFFRLEGNCSLKLMIMTFCLTTQVTEYLTSLLFGGTDIVIHDVAGAIPSLSKCYIMLGFENGYRVYYL